MRVNAGVTDPDEQVLAAAETSSTTSPVKSTVAYFGTRMSHRVRPCRSQRVAQLHPAAVYHTVYALGHLLCRSTSARVPIAVRHWRGRGRTGRRRRVLVRRAGRRPWPDCSSRSSGRRCRRAAETPRTVPTSRRPARTVLKSVPAARNALSAPRRSSAVRWRCSGVAIPPGISALAMMPSAAQRRVASTANSTLAVLDWP